MSLAAAYVIDRAALLRVAVRRMPLGGQIAPIALAFACSSYLFARIGGVPLQVFSWSFLAGALSFVLLFVSLRIADDLDDIERDRADLTSAARARLHRRLRRALIACFVVLAVLNVRYPIALLSASAAGALIVAGPFVFRRRFPQQRAVGAILYEGAPLLIFAYAYCHWRSTTGLALSAVAVAAVVAIFFGGYEFWKFSRKVHTEAMQPYFLSSVGVQIALNVWLALVCVAGIAAACTADLTLGYFVYALAVPVVLGVELNAMWRIERKRQRAGIWAGMTLIWAIELGILAQMPVAP